MTAGFRISDVVRQIGFSAATLRYYESIGLLPPPQRAANGYRRYDDGTLDRLAFIARARQLIEDLRHLAAALRRHRPDGPCDDRCGCTATEVPIACTLPAEAMPGRLDDWDRLLDHVETRSAIDGGVRLDLRPGVPVDELARLATAEQACCRFFSFAITMDGRGIGLEVRAAGDGLPVVHALFGVPA